MNIDKLKEIISAYNRGISNLNLQDQSEEYKFIVNTLKKNKIINLRNGRVIKKIKKEKLFIGKLQKKDNFGFLIIDNNEDMYTSNVNTYFDGDIVLAIQTYDRGKKDAVKLLELIQRNNAYIIVKKEKNGELKPLNIETNNQIIVKEMDQEQIRVNTIFSVLIEEIKDNQIIAEFNNIITDESDPDKDMKITLAKYRINVEFSDKVENELKGIKEEIEQGEIEKRVDLREHVFFTIDGKDSKDLDDAICLEKVEDKFKLYVSIADVSHYLKMGSAIDLEALDRATSVYFIDRVVPMIPKKISNGICSLHANVDRLTMTCEMLITSEGKVEDIKVYESIIDSKYRLTYEDVNKILMENDLDIISKYKDIYDTLVDMNNLSKKLKKKRFARGAFNLEDNEVKFVLDEDNNIIDLVPTKREDAEKLIEDFMIIANESVTKFVMKDELPFIYRVHGSPNKNKLDELRKVISHLGIQSNINLEKLNPKELKQIFDKIENPISSRVLTRTVVRSMQKAEYSEQNIGHFGLASNNYTHFTSPIRRYPDLQVHRLLKQYIHKDYKKTRAIELNALVASHSSEKEVKAIKAEQEIEDRKKAEYMKQFIGQTFKGTISGIEDYGIFVELENTIRGLVRFRDLKGYKTHTAFKVDFFEEDTLNFAQEIEVILVGVDLVRGLVDFVPNNYVLLTEEEKKEKKEKYYENKRKEQKIGNFKRKRNNKKEKDTDEGYFKRKARKKKNDENQNRYNKKKTIKKNKKKDDEYKKKISNKLEDNPKKNKKKRKRKKKRKNDNSIK